MAFDESTSRRVFGTMNGSRLLSPALGLKLRVSAERTVRQVVAPALREKFDPSGVRVKSLRHADRNPMKPALNDVEWRAPPARSRYIC
jgi:hypothetical protein